MNAPELATVLAALREYQRTARHLPDITDIATNGGEFPALDDAGIDALCERLNDGPRGGLRTYVVSAESASESKARGLAEAACLDDAPAGSTVECCKPLDADVFYRVRV